MARVSQVQVINVLCMAIGLVVAWDAWWIRRYWWSVCYIWQEVRRWLFIAGF